MNISPAKSGTFLQINSHRELGMDIKQIELLHQNKNTLQVKDEICVA